MCCVSLVILQNKVPSTPSVISRYLARSISIADSKMLQVQHLLSRYGCSSAGFLTYQKEEPIAMNLPDDT